MLVLDIDDRRWSAFVHAWPDASPFHHPRWAGLLAACYGYRPLALAMTDRAGRIAAGLPVLDVGSRFGRRRWVSLPFTDSCPPLVGLDEAGTLADALINELAARHVATFELRADLPLRARVHTHVGAVVHRLPLTGDTAEVARRFSKMHQRNLRLAQRSGVHVAYGSSRQDVDDFYRLHLLTRRRLGLPIQPRRFFALLAQDVLGAGLGFVVTARVADVPVAAAVFLTWNGVLVYKYGASDARYWSLRPNHALFSWAIRWGCENGYRVLDWGRTDLTDRGLREFKSGWGATESPLTYAVVADQPPALKRSRLRPALKVVIRHSSPLVCRALGEVFYRYAG